MQHTCSRHAAWDPYMRGWGLGSGVRLRVHSAFRHEMTLDWGNMAHARHTRPDPDPGFQVNVLKTFEFFPLHSYLTQSVLQVFLHTSIPGGVDFCKTTLKTLCER